VAKRRKDERCFIVEDIPDGYESDVGRMKHCGVGRIMLDFYRGLIDNLSLL
jgi:hypothetical protein